MAKHNVPNFLFQTFNNRSSQQRKHYLMVTYQTVTPAAFLSGPVNHIGYRPIMLNKVHVYRGEISNIMPKIPGQCQRLQKYLRHDDRGPEIYENTLI